MKSFDRVVLFLFGIFFVKLLVAAWVPVFGDEAYYYIWSLKPQLSYFDHPAMVSWLIFLSDHLFPSSSALGLRFSFVFLSLLTSLIWLQLLKQRQFSTNQLYVFFVLFNLNPLLGLGSVLATPDVPLVFFWTLAYYFYTQIFISRSLKDYTGLGVALGLGFCSKYHIVLFVLSGFLALIFEKKWKELKASGVLLTVVLGFIFCLPVLIWNSQNEWASFLFQIDHGFGEETFEWQWPVNYILTQVMLMSPFLFYVLLTQVKSGADRWFVWTQLGFFLTSSFKSVVEGNWPISSHLHAVSGTLSYLNKKILRLTFINWFIFYALIGGFFLSSFSSKVRKNLINEAQLEELYPLVKEYAPLYGPMYQVSALMTWKTRHLVPKLTELSRIDFFDSLPASVPATKEFYALKYNNSNWPERYDAFKKTQVRSFDKLEMGLYHFKYE